MDFFKSAVVSAISKGPLAAYTVGDRVDLDHSIWTLNNGIKREGGAKCSIFTFDINASRSRLPLAKNAARRFRTLRHPGVVQVLETIETDANIYIITERLTPLAWFTQRSDLSEETIKWGVWNIAKTVKFINEDASSVHCLLRLSSIFAGESGEWKLGGFELLSSTKDEEDSVLNAYSSIVPTYRDGLPPEVGKSGWSIYKTTPWAAVDAYGYGVLLSELFGGAAPAPGQVPNISNVPRDMQQICKRLVNTNPKIRPSVSNLLDQGQRNGGFFQTPLIRLSETIDSLGLKTETERDDFLRELKDVWDQFPEDYLRRKLLPELLKSIEFGGGGPKVFAVVLQIGTKLSVEEYDTLLTPVLIRLFSSPDRALRVCLLDSLPLMIDHLPQKIVNDKIFPNLVTGFTDMAPLVREQTVKSVLTIIPKLSDRVVNGDLLKYLAKTSNDSEPGIRTNTTVCLGKIAKYIGASTRTKVLIAAFSRSLRDPFVHARHAALLALGATADMFTEDDCATKLLPCICPSLVDKEKLVRDQANKALGVYLQRIQRYAQSLPTSVLPPPSVGTPEVTGATPHVGTPSVESSWTGWAISSFASKFTGPEVAGDIESKPNDTTTRPIMTTTASGNPISMTVAALSTTNPLGPASAALAPPLSRQTTETTKMARAFIAPESAEHDGFWDNMDDGGGAETAAADDAWGGMADDDDDANDAWADVAQTSTRTSTVTAAKSNKTSTPSTHYDDKGEPDFAGWLKAQQTKPAKAALPKGLGTKTLTSPAGSRPSSSSSSSRQPTVAAQAKKTGLGVVGPHKASAAPVPAAKVSKMPKVKAEVEDEAWGDAWD